MSDNYVYLPGTSNNAASIPDNAVFNTTDLWVAALVALDDWTPSSNEALVTKWKWTTNQRQFTFYVNTSGRLVLGISSDGTDETFSTSSVSPTVSDGERLWVGAFFDNSEDEVTFYTGGSGAAPTWATLGSVQANAETGFDSTAIFYVGADDANANHAAGKFYKAEVGSTLQGAEVVSIDFTDSSKYAADKSTLTEDSSNALTVTMNGDEWVYVNRDLIVNNALLSRAEAIYLARDGNGAYGPNTVNPWADLSGNDHHAQLGSATGADTNDPLFLGYDGEKYIHFPSVSGNYLSLADNANWQVGATDTVDIRVKAAADDWTPTGASTIVGQYNTSTNQRNFRVRLDTSGAIEMAVSDDGTNNDSQDMSFDSAKTDGEAVVFRVTWVASTGLCTLFTSDDEGETWTAQADTETTTITGALHDSTNVMEIGSSNVGTSNLFAGKIYWVQVYIGGTLVLDFNAEDLQEPFATVTDRANGATITLNRASSGRKLTVVDQDLWLLGTDDSFEVPDHDDLDMVDGQDFTLMAAFRKQGTTSGADPFISKKVSTSTAQVGYAMYLDGNTDPVLLVSDGTNEASDINSTSPTAGVRTIVVGRHDDTANEVETFINSSGTGTPGDASSVDTLINGEVLEIGELSTFFFAGEIMAIAIFREALDQDDINSLQESLFPTADDLLILQNISSIVRSYDDPYEQVLGDGFTERTLPAVRRNQELVSTIVKRYK